MHALLSICIVTFVVASEPRGADKPAAEPRPESGIASASAVQVTARGIDEFQFTISIANVESREELGNAANAVLTINTGLTESRIVGLGWTTNQRAGGTLPPVVQPNSWLTEMEMYFDDNVAPDGVGAFVHPSNTQDTGTESGLTSGGIIRLSAMGVGDIYLPDGVVRIEFEESFNDGPGVDGVYLSGSSVQVLVHVHSPPVCGDNFCDVAGGETCVNCVQDCPACCGNNECESSESCVTCESDCGACADCGDSVCDTNGGESCANCPSDCGACCGNSTCEPGLGEDCENCPSDCGSCCGNLVCEAALGETCLTCPTDCAICCGNGECESSNGETCQSCPVDCGSCCGNGVCDLSFGENCSNCVSDCAVGDADGDGDLDRADYAMLAGCLAGPAQATGPSCTCLDFDGDGNIDLRDFAGFQRDFDVP